MKTEMKPVGVAAHVYASVSGIKVWLARGRKEESLRNRTGRGRKPVLSCVAKIVLAKDAFKRHRSVRKLAMRLTAKGHPASKTTVHKCMTKCLHLKALKLRRLQKLAEAQNR